MLTPTFEMVGRFEEHRLPNGEVVYFEPNQHRYYGEVKPNAQSEGGYSYVQSSQLTGASTIAKHLNDQGDGLLYWAAGLDQRGIATLIQRDIAAAGSRMVVDLAWLEDPEAINRRLRDEELTWKHVRDQMAEWGTNVHEKIFLALTTEGAPPSLADLSDAERGFGQAVFAWWNDRSPEPLEAEQVTVSHARRFAGRFDLRCEVEIEGERVKLLVDAKTRSSGKVRRSDLVQLAGYEIANVECGIGATDRRLALLLLPDGTYIEKWSVATEADFNSALNACRSGKHLDKRMREAEQATEAVVA